MLNIYTMMNYINKRIKIFYLAAVLLTLTTAEVAFIPQLPALSKFEYSNPSNPNDLVCYMQSENGMTLNLDSLCGSKRPVDFLPAKDRRFIENYQARLMGASPEAQNVLLPIAEENPQAIIRKATELCNAIDNGKAVQFRQTQAEMIDKYDVSGQKTAIVNAGILDSLSRKYYCPEFDY